MGMSRQPSDPQHMKREFAQPDTLPSQPYGARGGAYMHPPEYAAPAQHQPQQPPPPSNSYNHSSPYAAPTPRPVVAAPRSNERRQAAGEHAREMDGYADGNQGSSAVSRQAGATGEALSAGPAVREDANGERRVASSEEIGGGREPEVGFTAVNS